MREYLLHLSRDRHAAPRTMNQAVAALRFLFVTTLGRPAIVASVPYARQDDELPNVLSREEVVQLLDVVRRPKYLGAPNRRCSRPSTPTSRRVR